MPVGESRDERFDKAFASIARNLSGFGANERVLVLKQLRNISRMLVSANVPESFNHSRSDRFGVVRVRQFESRNRLDRLDCSWVSNLAYAKVWPRHEAL
jgi:hypothetical protein